MPPQGLRISQRDEGAWRILTLMGSVDASSFVWFEQELTRLVESGGLFVRLELGGLKSINSTGLGLLMATHRQLRQKGRRLVIDGLSAEITNILNLLGLSRLMQDEGEGEAGAAALR